MPKNKQGEFKDMIVMRFMMKTAAMMTTMAGPRTVGLGCFSPVQPSGGRLFYLKELFVSMTLTCHGQYMV